MTTKQPLSTKKPLSDRLHDELHAIPGMPSHDEAAMLNTNAAAQRAHAKNANVPHSPASANPRRNSGSHHNNPRVLVGWQQFIGGLFQNDKK